MIGRCLWCAGPFTPMNNGGRRRRFCRDECRIACYDAGRTWAVEALADGRLTVAALRRALGQGEAPSADPLDAALRDAS